MIHIKDHKTRYMFDPFGYLGQKRKQLLECSWAGVFRDHIRPILPVHLLAEHFSEDMGRPTNELVAMMGTMILQQMHDLSDEETVNQFAFNIQWHYALDITGKSDKDTYVSPKSIWNIRHIMSEHNLYQPVFEGVADHLAKAFEVDSSLQRLDSVHIFSNMRHLGRIGIFVKTTQKFLTNLKRHHRGWFDSLDPEFTNRYLRKEEESAFSMVKPSESSRTLEILGNDLFFLVERFSSHPDVITMSSYQLMVRVLRDQCRVEEDPDAHTRKVTIKPNKEVPSDSLQNPSDPNAGYDGHKGKGYQVQVAETFCTDQDQGALSLITYVEVEPAHESDANALIPCLESTNERGLAPERLLADTLYGSDHNCEKAKELGVEVVSPCRGCSPDGQCSLADFTFSNDAKALTCPRGHAPLKTQRKKNRLSAVFASETCAACPLLDNCPVKAGSRGYYLRYDGKTLRLARRRAMEATPEFMEKYRFRAGVEATMSQLDRRTGVKHLRVRGMKAVRLCAFLKATGINILRTAAFKRRKNVGNSPANGASSPSSELFSILSTLFQLVKELFTWKMTFSCRRSFKIGFGFQS
jgi:hypothetical protein